MTSILIAQRVEELDPYLEAWDQLAGPGHQPLSRPGWLLAWWRAKLCQRQFRGELRVVVVCDERGLAGVAPLFIEDPRASVVAARFLGHGTMLGVHPLIRNDGAEGTVKVLSEAIASLRPRPNIIYFEMIDADSIWPEALVDHWPGRRGWLRVHGPDRGSAIRLDGTFDGWVQSRSIDWRSDYRRRQRRLFERGGVIRRARTTSEMSRALAELIRLHRIRWNAPDPLTPVVVRTLHDAGEQLLASDGFRLWTVEINDKVIAASLFVTAGRSVTLHLTAFDREWGRFAPGRLSIVAGVEEAFRRGDDIIDLWYGDFGYKYALANEARSVCWYELFPRHDGYLRARASALPRHGRDALHRARMDLALRTRLAEARRSVSMRFSPSADR